jgi:alpha-mannosidase
MTAKVAIIEPWSNDFCKLVLEKCWKAKYTAINREITAPSFVSLAKRIMIYKFLF